MHCAWWFMEHCRILHTDEIGIANSVTTVHTVHIIGAESNAAYIGQSQDVRSGLNIFQTCACPCVPTSFSECCFESPASPSYAENPRSPSFSGEKNLQVLYSLNIFKLEEKTQ